MLLLSNGVQLPDSPKRVAIPNTLPLRIINTDLYPMYLNMKPLYYHILSDIKSKVLILNDFF